MRRVPGSSVIAGMFGRQAVKTAADAFDPEIRAAIKSAETHAEKESSLSFLQNQSRVQTAPQDNHQPYGLGVVKLGYSPTMFREHNMLPGRNAKTPTPQEDAKKEANTANVLQFKQPGR